MNLPATRPSDPRPPSRASRRAAHGGTFMRAKPAFGILLLMALTLGALPWLLTAAQPSSSQSYTNPNDPDYVDETLYPEETQATAVARAGNVAYVAFGDRIL